MARAAAFAPPRVAIARAGAPLPIEAAKQAALAGIMEPVLIGERKDIEAQAEAAEWDIAGFDLYDTTGEAEAAGKAAELCGTGHAQVLMKGQVHSDVFMKAALNREAGLRTENRLVHIFHISHPDGGRPILISDAAVNVAPNFETRKSAVLAVTGMMHMLGTPHPKIAILSATETPIASVPSSVEARELADWARAHVQGADVAGPLALDLILSPGAVATKGMAADGVAGMADAIIVPDIVSGNALFKSLVYLSGGCAAGIVMGARVPILLTSRADPPAARLASAALAAIVCGSSPD